MKKSFEKWIEFDGLMHCHVCERAWKEAYKKGFADGATKQAILELQGRDKFLEGLAKKEK